MVPVRRRPLSRRWRQSAVQLATERAHRGKHDGECQHDRRRCPAHAADPGLRGQCQLPAPDGTGAGRHRYRLVLRLLPVPGAVPARRGRGAGFCGCTRQVAESLGGIILVSEYPWCRCSSSACAVERNPGALGPLVGLGRLVAYQTSSACRSCCWRRCAVALCWWAGSLSADESPIHGHWSATSALGAVSIRSWLLAVVPVRRPRAFSATTVSGSLRRWTWRPTGQRRAGRRPSAPGTRRTRPERRGGDLPSRSPAVRPDPGTRRPAVPAPALAPLSDSRQRVLSCCCRSDPRSGFTTTGSA